MATLRSSLRNTPRKKYTNDPFEGLDNVLETSSSESGTEDDSDEDGAQSSDIGEIVPNESSDEVANSPDVQMTDEVPAIAAEPSPNATEPTPNAAGPTPFQPLPTKRRYRRRQKTLDPSSDDSRPPKRRGRPPKQRPADDLDKPRPSPKTTKGKSSLKQFQDQGRPPPPETNAAGEILYTRGLPSTVHGSMRPEAKRIQYHGPAEEDHGPVSKAYERWCEGRGLPKRSDPATRSTGGFAHTDAYEKQLQNAESNWKWYSEDGGKDAFLREQKLEFLPSEEVGKYLPIDGSGQRSLVVGAPGRYQMHTLEPRDSVVISKPAAGLDSTAEPHQTKDSGFILNIGARVRCLEWALNRANDRTQYLAISTMPDSALGSSAFTPQSKKSNIHLWEIKSDGQSSIDTSTPSKLARMLGVDFGDVKTMKWCPVPSKAHELGLLAFVCGDGAVRIVDMDAAVSSDGVSSLLSKCAFEAKPPDTVCTSLAWLSSSRIAAGCANGFVAVWDVPAALSSETSNPRPIIYAGISMTYINELTSCWPSYPDMLITTSMDGHISLTDLSKSQPSSPTNTAISIRSPIPPLHTIWHDHGHCAVSVDDNTMIKAYPLRRWFNAIGVGKTKAHATALATSPCHPLVIFGQANGDVVGCDPLQKLAGPVGASIYQRKWFAHEWRRPTEEEKSADEASAIAKNGLTRIADGFQPYHEALKQYDFTPGKNTGVTTIFEEESAVTALAWNPNLNVAGWAAAGMADGLVRIEDVSCL